MGHALLNQLLGFKSRLVGAHEDTWVHSEQVYFFQGVLTANIAGAHVQVGKPTADDLVFFIFVLERHLLLTLSNAKVILPSLN